MRVGVHQTRFNLRILVTHEILEEMTAAVRDKYPDFSVERGDSTASIPSCPRTAISVAVTRFSPWLYREKILFDMGPDTSQASHVHPDTAPRPFQPHHSTLTADSSPTIALENPANLSLVSD